MKFSISLSPQNLAVCTALADFIASNGRSDLDPHGGSGEAIRTGNRQGVLGCIRSAAIFIAGAVSVLVPGAVGAKEESAARAFAGQALAFRAAVVAGEESAVGVLAAMPGSARVARGMLPILWGPSFANAIVKLGRLGSSGPVALYYDPLLDIAAIAFWRQDAGTWRVVSARALPGERLVEPDAEAPLSQAWLSARDGLVGTLAGTVKARLDAFSRRHPADGQTEAHDTATFATAAGDMRAALARLIRHAERRARWTDRAQPWLKTTLSAVEKSLAARDPAVLRSAAPETDTETVAALAALPEGYTGRLALDMILETGKTDRLLIGSSTGDGDIYVLVLCRLVGAGPCSPRRFMLVSLLE